MNVFIDTEFTNFLNPHLISLGMASEYGEDFYAEVPYPRLLCICTRSSRAIAAENTAFIFYDR